MELNGIFPVLPVPFRADGTVDVADFRAAVAFAVAAGAHGVVFPGVASEYAFLTRDERRQLLDGVAEVVAGRCPIIAGASGDTPAEISGYCAAAAHVGAAAVMVMAAPALGGSTDEIVASLAAVDTAGLPMILQNAPAPIGANLSPAAIHQTIEQVDAVRFVKEEGLPAGQRIGRLLAAASPGLLGVLGGGGARAIIEELSRGACGAMPATELVDLHVALYDAWCAGDVDAARGYYAASLPLLTMQAVFRTGLTKQVLRLRGVISNVHVRADYPAMDEADRRECTELVSRLDAAGLLRPCELAAAHG